MITLSNDRVGVLAKRVGDGWADGWEHRRSESGFCLNCGARSGEMHYALVPRTS